MVRMAEENRSWGYDYDGPGSMRRHRWLIPPQSTAWRVAVGEMDAPGDGARSAAGAAEVANVSDHLFLSSGRSCRVTPTAKPPEL